MTNNINKFINEEPKKVLIIKQRQLGDVLMGTAAIQAFKEKFPNAQVDFLTEKKCLPIVENNPYINKIYVIDKKEQSSIFKQISFYKNIAKNNYDTVIALQTLPRVILQVLFSKAKYKLGPYSKTYKNLLFTHLTRIEEDYPALENIEILKPFNILKPSKITGHFYLTENDKEKAREILLENNLKEDNILIVIDPSHKDFRRAYPPKHYVKLLNYIQEKIPQAVFYFSYAPGEENQVRDCVDGLNDMSRTIILDKCPPLSVSAAIVAQADYHIGACSFPRHLAVSFAIPSTSLIGISHTNWDYPEEKHLVVKTSLDCQPCANHRKCHNPRCMYELYPELIQDKVVEHIMKFTEKNSI